MTAFGERSSWLNDNIDLEGTQRFGTMTISVGKADQSSYGYGPELWVKLFHAYTRAQLASNHRPDLLVHFYDPHRELTPTFRCLQDQ